MGWTYQRTKVEVAIPEGIDPSELRLLYFDERDGRITEDLPLEDAIEPCLVERVVGIGQLATGQAVVLRFDFQEERAALVPIECYSIIKGSKVNSFHKLYREWGLKGRALQIALGHLCPTDPTSKAKWQGKSKWGRRA